MTFLESLDSNSFHARKKERTQHFEKYVKGWKLVTCGACNGSGYYDYSRRGRTPKCSNCEGTGKERVSPEEYKRNREWEAQEAAREDAREQEILKTWSPRA